MRVNEYVCENFEQLFNKIEFKINGIWKNLLFRIKNVNKSKRLYFISWAIQLGAKPTLELSDNMCNFIHEGPFKFNWVKFKYRGILNISLLGVKDHLSGVLFDCVWRKITNKFGGNNIFKVLRVNDFFEF